MCQVCYNFDFGTAKFVIDSNQVSLVRSGGSSRFPIYERFKFCPECGKLINHSMGRKVQYENHN